MACSDLDDLLQESADSKDFVKSLTKVVKAKDHPEWDVLGVLESLQKSHKADEEDNKEDSKDSNASSEEPIYNMPVCELAKNMVLQSTSTKDPVSSYQRIDWAANKRVYKHKAYIK